jgi:hypothetical protein
MVVSQQKGENEVNDVNSAVKGTFQVLFPSGHDLRSLYSLLKIMVQEKIGWNWTFSFPLRL